MVWCNYCVTNISRPDIYEGKTCCSMCGRVLDEDNFAQEPTFIKGAGGQSQMQGVYVKSIQDVSVSRQRTLDEAHYGIEDLMNSLGIDGGDSISSTALNFYRMALERNFTRGRRRELVEATCLYMTCRVNKKPFLLIDFSEHLRINVYVLGAVFLQLCKVFSLQDHPIVQKPVDPSLFIHRFTDRLFGSKKPNVSRTALHIISSMKRDWIQTGRKPSGLCGAALYISALSHGHKYSKSDIIRVVRICEATLTKRLIEFENTESGSLTIEEFNTKAEELEKKARLIKPIYSGSKESEIGELLCEHKGSAAKPFAHGLCKDCFDEFRVLSGGLDGGSEPPAFQRAEMERIMAKEAAALSSEHADSPIMPNSDKQGRIKYVSEHEDSQPRESAEPGAILQDGSADEPGNDRTEKDEAGDFSDLDEDEVDTYLLKNEEEKELKRIVWETMNKEFLAEQKAKEAEAEAARLANEALYANCSEEVKAARKLAEEARAAVAKSKKEKQQKPAAELKNRKPAQTAVEATKQILDKKKLSSKIRYDVLEDLFDESGTPETTKKMKIDTNDKEEVPETETFDDDTYTGDYDAQDYNYDEYDYDGYNYDT